MGGLFSNINENTAEVSTNVMARALLSTVFLPLVSLS